METLVRNKAFGNLLIAESTVLPTGLHQIKKCSIKGNNYQSREGAHRMGLFFQLFT
jgi:hypothetical protein